MIAHPDFRRALARDRSEELQATAADWRRVRQARAAAGPAAAKSTAANGAPTRLADGFARLSERFRWLRGVADEPCAKPRGG